MFTLYYKLFSIYVCVYILHCVDNRDQRQRDEDEPSRDRDDSSKG